MSRVGNLQRIYDKKSVALNPIKRLTSHIPITIRRYSHLDDKGQKDNGAKEKEKQHSQKKERDDQGHHGQGPAERAPSTAEEFERVAEAKARQGLGNQTLEKTEDGFQETPLADSTPESVKENFEEPGEIITS